MTYDKKPTTRGTLVVVKARGDEIVEAMKVALGVIRGDIAGKGIGKDHGAISIRSIDMDLTFAITVFVEHGGMKVIINGNVGGVYKEHKLTSAQKVDDDWISRATAGLFMVSGGKADDMVQIEYKEDTQ